MPQISGGRVVYSRTTQPAQYESKRAEVELAFVLADNEDIGDTIADLLDQVRKEVHTAVGIRRRE
jgi:2-keto-4-pentenoate hydratase